MSIYLKLVIILLFNIFEQYILYRYMVIFFDNKPYNTKISLTAYTLRCIVPIYLNAKFPYVIASMLVSNISTFMVIATYRGNIFKKFFVTFFIYACAFLTEFIIVIPIGISNKFLFDKIEFDNLTINLFKCIINWTITLIVQKFKNAKNNVPIPKIFIIAVAIVPVSSLIITFLIASNPDFDRTLNMVALLCMVASNFAIMYFFDSMSKIFKEKAQVELVKQERNYYHEQSNVLLNNQNNITALRHDMKNHIMAIQVLISQKKYEEADNYMNTLTDNLKAVRQHCNSENLIIDSVINYKFSIAEENNIKVSCEITVPPTLNIEDDDIVIILSNLLDNAIEAASQVENEPFIHVKIDFNMGTLYITITNNYCTELNYTNGKLQTTKEDQTLHGIGLRSANVSAEKYNGKVECTPDDDKKIFTASVSLYPTNTAVPSKATPNRKAVH